MLRQADGGHLKSLPNIPNLNAYVMSWAVAWHYGDKKHCLSRLEAVYLSLHPQPAKAATAAKPALADFEPNPPKRQPKVYSVPDSAEPTTCACGAEIWFVPTPSGATMPVTADGVSHFETCPDAAKFSRSKKAAEPKPPGKFPSKDNPLIRPPKKAPARPGSKKSKKAAPPPKAEGGQQRLMF